MRLDRRQFLRAASVGAASTLLPDRLLADPYAPLPRTVREVPAAVRVRGVVRNRGRGLAGVPVSDGLDVVRTDRDGDFELARRATVTSCGCRCRPATGSR